MSKYGTLTLEADDDILNDVLSDSIVILQNRYE